MPPHKIPKEDFIYQIVKDVVKKRGIVNTQEELCLLVSKKLKSYDPEFSLTPKRVKRIALKVPEIRIKAKTKKSLKMNQIKKCPVCTNKIKKVYGKNLLNKKIHIGYICKKCGLSTDLSSVAPMRYIFVWK